MSKIHKNADLVTKSALILKLSGLKLTIVQLGIESLLSKELFVISAFDNVAVLHYKDKVGIFYS